MAKEISLQFSQEDLEQVDIYFQAYTGVDVQNIPEKYEDYILQTREIMVQKGDVRLMYGTFPIASQDETKVVLEDGLPLESKLVAKAFASSQEVTMFVTSVVNIDEILEEQDDEMDIYFLEYWAVSMMNVGRKKFITAQNQQLEANHQKCTSVWSPGQGTFRLHNQKTLFALLHPETMGVTLDKYNRMIPLKSVSGVVGLVPTTFQETLISCDFCDFRETCPGYAGEKYQHLQKQRRLG